MQSAISGFNINGYMFTMYTWVLFIYTTRVASFMGSCAWPRKLTASMLGYCLSWDVPLNLTVTEQYNMYTMWNSIKYLNWNLFRQVENLVNGWPQGNSISHKKTVSLDVFESLTHRRTLTFKLLTLLQGERGYNKTCKCMHEDCKLRNL